MVTRRFARAEMIRFYAARLVNEIHAYIAPKIFGGAQAPGPIGGEGIALPEDALRFSNVVASQLGEDLFIECEVN